MAIRNRVNFAVVAFVGLGMPAYYKVKYLLLGQIELAEILHWTIVIDLAFSSTLAASVLLVHDVVVERIRRQFADSTSHLKRLVMQFLVTAVASLAVVYAFTFSFFTYLYPSVIPSDFLFDMFLLGLFLPVFVGGVKETMFYYGEWETAATKRPQSNPRLREREPRRRRLDSFPPSSNATRYCEP